MRLRDELDLERHRSRELQRALGHAEGVLAEREQFRLANPVGDEDGSDGDSAGEGTESLSSWAHDAADDVREHPGKAVAGGLGGASAAVLGAAAGGAAGSAVGTAAAAGAIYLIERHRERGHAASLGAAVAGGLVTGIALLGGSLQGAPALGSTTTRLKTLAARVKLRGLEGLAQSTSEGLGLSAIADRLGRAVNGLSVAAALSEARTLGRSLATSPGRASVRGSEEYSTSGWKWSPN